MGSAKTSELFDLISSSKLTWMPMVTEEAIFWLCQHSPSTDGQGCSSVDDRAILTGENTS